MLGRFFTLGSPVITTMICHSAGPSHPTILPHRYKDNDNDKGRKLKSCKKKFKNTPVCPDIEDSSRLYSNVFCPVNVTSMPGSSLPDIQSTEAAIRF